MITSEWRTAWEDMDRKALLPWHRRVLCALACSMGGNGGQGGNCYPGVDRIGKRCGYNQSRVREVLRELDELGWINISRRQGAANRYYAVVPNELAGSEAKPAKSAKRQTPAQKCWQCGSTKLRPYLYQGEDTGMLVCGSCDAKNDPEPAA